MNLSCMSHYARWCRELPARNSDMMRDITIDTQQQIVMGLSARKSLVYTEIRLEIFYHRLSCAYEISIAT